MIMKKTWVKISTFLFAIALLAPASLLAQNEKEKEKEAKEEKVKEKKEVRQIIVTIKGDKDEKIVVEVAGDKIIVNGKSLDELKDKNGDINVRLNKLKDIEALTITRGSKGDVWNNNFGDAYNNYNESYKMYNEDANTAMLGVTTEKTETGLRIQGITKESAAEKAGLKEGDIITKIDDKKMEDPDDLSKAIRAHKPGDKVSVTYLRDKKEQKATAELGKWKGMALFGKTAPGQNFNLDLGDMDFERIMPRTLTAPRALTPYGQNWNWSGGSPKLGLSVQDTDDGKGVKVIEVDEESNAAKAGIKEDDVIMEADGKAVNSTDDMVKVVKESKEKNSIMIKLQRNGKTQNVEVKMPKKIKTADL
jgi:serine protease Do